jgi:hypothetical protein
VGRNDRKGPLGRHRRRYVILKWVFQKLDGGEGIKSVGLLEKRESFRAVVNAVMNFGFP